MEVLTRSVPQWQYIGLVTGSMVNTFSAFFEIFLDVFHKGYDLILIVEHKMSSIQMLYANCHANLGLSLFENQS